MRVQNKKMSRMKKISCYTSSAAAAYDSLGFYNTRQRGWRSVKIWNSGYFQPGVAGYGRAWAWVGVSVRRLGL